MIIIGDILNKKDLCNHTIKDSSEFDAYVIQVCVKCNYAYAVSKKDGIINFFSTCIDGTGVWIYRDRSIVGSKQLDYRIVNDIDPITFCDTVRKRLLLI
jgi:hypothetical protein